MAFTSLPITTAASTLTGAQGAAAIENAAAVKQTLADAITFAQSGLMVVGGVVKTLEYNTGTGIGGNDYQLVDGATSRPAVDGGSVIHVTGGSGFLYLNGLFLNGILLEQFGAKQSNSDNYSEITACWTYAYSLTNLGQIGVNTYSECNGLIVSQTIVQPNGVSFQGIGRSEGVFVCSGGFTDAILHQLGSGGLAFNTMCKDAGFDCNDKDVMGAFSDSANELSGYKRCFIKRSIGTSLKIVHAGAGQAQNYTLKDIEVLISDLSTGSAVGVDISGGGADTRGISEITVNRIGNTSAGDTGFLFDGLRGSLIQNLNCEGVLDGIVIGSRSSSVGFAIAGINGNANVTNLVKISNNFVSDGFLLTGISSSGATNSLVDLSSGLTTTKNRVGLYQKGIDGTILTDIIAQRNIMQSTQVNNVLSVSKSNTGAGANCKIAITKDITASGGVVEIEVTVESTSAGSISISGKTTVACLANIRHAEERQFGFALLTDGTIAGSVNGTQVGTSAGAIVLNAPSSLSTATANKFRVIITNNTAQTSNITITLDLCVQGGRVVSYQ